MSPPMRPFVVVLVFFCAAPIGADDRPAAKSAKPPSPLKPADARRAALIRAGYTPIPLQTKPRILGFHVDAAIGAEKVKFDLDSGATWTSVDLALAKRLKMELGQEAVSVGLDGGQIGRWTFIRGLTIGAFDPRKDFPNIPADAVDLSGHPGSPEGVFGMDVLVGRGAVIDFPARTMYLRSSLTTAWPRFAGAWTVTRWQEDGTVRTLDPKVPPTFTFADRRLKMTDRGKTREYALRFRPDAAADYLLFVDPKKDGQLDPVSARGGALVKVKDGAMTLCMLLDPKRPSEFPTEFAAPKGSGLHLLELKRTTLAAKPADPLRDALLKDGYTAVPMDREPSGLLTTAARIGRHDLRLLVDTGTSFSSFDTAGLDRWGAIRLGAFEGHALRGKVMGENINLRGFQVGGYDTRRAFGVIYGCGIDLSGVNKTLADHKMRPFQGLIGNLDLLNGSAVMDLGSNTLYLKPVKETVWPRLAGKWVGVRYEQNGRKGPYAPGDAAVEFKNGRIRFTTPNRTAEWGFHLEDELDWYRVGLFDAGADELADGFRYSGGGLLLRLTGDTLGIVMGEPTTFSAPKGSRMLLVEYERVK